MAKAAAIMYVPLLLLAKMMNKLDSTYDTFGGHMFNVHLIIQMLSWVSQFVGHGIFEKRAPAIMTNVLFMFLEAVCLYLQFFLYML